MLRVDALSAASAGIKSSVQQFDSAAANIVTSALTAPVAEVATPPFLPPAEAPQPAPDVAGEIVNMVLAQTGVGANVTVVQRAVDAYRDLLAMTNTDRDRLAASAPVTA
jgi:hypothetical protein